MVNTGKCVGFAVFLGLAASAELAKGQDAADVSTSGPKVVADQELIDLGRIKGGDKAHVTFTLRNEGDAQLDILDIQESCGCTVARLEQEEKSVAPGGETRIAVTFDSTGRNGPQNPTLRVTTNDPDRKSLELAIVVDVYNPFTLEPSRVLAFQNGRRGQDINRTIRVVPSDPQGNIEVLELSLKDPTVRVRAEPSEISGRKSLLLTFTLDDDAPLGDLETTGKIRLRINNEEAESELVVRGLIIGDLSYRPSQLFVMRNTERGRELPPITVTSMTKRPFEITKVESGPYLIPTVTPKNADRTEYKVTLQLAHHAPGGALATELMIHTDTLEHPLLEIPTFVSVPPVVDIDPLLIRLTPGESINQQERRLRLKTVNKEPIAISAAQCSLPFVQTEIIPPGMRTNENVAVVMTRLVQPIPGGDHHGWLTVQTNIPGAEKIEIPVEVLQPKVDPAPASVKTDQSTPPSITP